MVGYQTQLHDSTTNLVPNDGSSSSSSFFFFFLNQLMLLLQKFNHNTL